MATGNHTQNLVVIRGGGDIASGIAHRLHRAGLGVVVTEVSAPRALRRAVSFASALYEGSIVVEGVEARRAESAAEAQALVAEGRIAVLVDPECTAVDALRPEVLVDAILAKRNLGTARGAAPLVVGVGPGFCAGTDVDVVIETKRGHYLGRVIDEGSAQPNTGVPGEILGLTRERVLWSPATGTLQAGRPIGSRVEAGETVAEVGGQPLVTAIGGVLRGLLHDGLPAREGEKVGDVDPRGVRDHCFTISDKARAVGGGVLEAILHARSQRAS